MGIGDVVWWIKAGFISMKLFKKSIISPVQAIICGDQAMESVAVSSDLLNAAVL